MYSGGDGTIENPYLIATSADFFNIRYNLNAHYKQVADINMSDISWEPVGTFSGSYDGAGHKIYNLDLGSSMALNYGLFGQIQPTSGRTWVKNITLVNPKVNQTISGAIKRYFGFLAGQAINTDFINCNIYQGEIDFTSESETTEPFEDLGGICGKTSDCRFENCKVEINLNVYESKDVGFICGYTYPDASEEDTVVAKCEVSGKFKGSFWYAGGIAGRAGGEVSKCSASMIIEGSGTQVGGLIGVSLGHVYECFSVATLHGKFGESSPLIGRTAGGIVENCYSHGQINLEADGLNIYWKAGGLTGGY
mgnify:FL=1